jgi:hypothetical protein
MEFLQLPQGYVHVISIHITSGSLTCCQVFGTYFCMCVVLICSFTGHVLYRERSNKFTVTPMVNMQFEVEITLDECCLCLVNVETDGMCYQCKTVYGG